MFRVDATADIGGGHVMRCLALAAALTERRWRCVFISAEESTAIVPQLARAGHELLTLAADDLLDPAAAARQVPTVCDLLVIDHYSLDAAYERVLRTRGQSLLAIDDLADRPHEADLLLDATPGRAAADYAALVPPSCRMLLGPEYALLRTEFRAQRGAALARRGRPVERIFVSFGSVDRRDATSLALDALQLAFPDPSGAPHIDVVVGAGTVHRKRLNDRVARYPLSTALYVGTDAMADMLTAADLAIGAPGTTSLERCCLGLPALLMAVADNQLGWGSALDRLGCARYLGPIEDVNADRLTEAIRVAIADGGWRGATAAAGSALCDGLGTHRVAELVSAGRR